MTVSYSIECPTCRTTITMQPAPAEQFAAAYRGMEHESPGAASFIRIPAMWNGLCACGAVMTVTRLTVAPQSHA